MSENASQPIPSAVVIDLRRQSPKRIRQLRQGRGRLLRIVEDTVLQMQQERGEQESNQPIIIIVERKRRRRLYN
jgi:Family of unknown function (DUF6200)